MFVYAHPPTVPDLHNNFVYCCFMRSSPKITLTENTCYSTTSLMPWWEINHDKRFPGTQLEQKLLMSSSVNVAAVAAKSLQSCPTLCDPIDGSPPGSPVPGILQARTLEWVVSFSNAWKWKWSCCSRVWLLATPWTAAYQAPPSMWFSRQEYWSGLPLPSLLLMLNLIYVEIVFWFS